MRLHPFTVELSHKGCYVVYAWDRYPPGDEREGDAHRANVGSFRTLEEADTAYPLAILRDGDGLLRHGNPIAEHRSRHCPSCGGTCYSLACNIPLVYRCATCRVTICARTWEETSARKQPLGEGYNS